MSLLDSHWKKRFKVGSWVACQVLAFIAIALTLGTHLPRLLEQVTPLV